MTTSLKNNSLSLTAIGHTANIARNINLKIQKYANQGVIFSSDINDSKQIGNVLFFSLGQFLDLLYSAIYSFIKCTTYVYPYSKRHGASSQLLRFSIKELISSKLFI